jgi:hypothetical protein
MKKYIIVLIVTLISSPFFAQTTAFDKFSAQDNIKTIVVNKKMFELMSKVKVDASDLETQRYMNLIKKLDNLKVYTTTSTSTTSDMKSTAEKYVKTAGLDELMRINDKGKNVKISVKSSGTDNQIQELLMFIEGGGSNNETVLMSLTGNFNLNEISILTDKMKIPGGEDLKKVTKQTK